MAKTSATKTTRGFVLKGPKGEKLTLDMASISGTASQKAALRKLLRSGDLGTLSDTERNKISEIKYKIPSLPGDGTALIVRFDWTWVRIDELADLNTRVLPGPFKFSKAKTAKK